jgi:hypothetical protein
MLIGIIVVKSRDFACTILNLFTKVLLTTSLSDKLYQVIFLEFSTKL